MTQSATTQSNSTTKQDSITFGLIEHCVHDRGSTLGPHCPSTNNFHSSNDATSQPVTL